MNKVVKTQQATEADDDSDDSQRLGSASLSAEL